MHCTTVPDQPAQPSSLHIQGCFLLMLTMQFLVMQFLVMQLQFLVMQLQFLVMQLQFLVMQLQFLVMQFLVMQAVYPRNAADANCISALQHGSNQGDIHVPSTVTCWLQHAAKCIDTACLPQAGAQADKSWRYLNSQMEPTHLTTDNTVPVLPLTTPCLS